MTTIRITLEADIEVGDESKESMVQYCLENPTDACEWLISANKATLTVEDKVVELGT